DVLVRLLGSRIDREHRTSLHVTASHHAALTQHLADGGHAFQACIAAVEPVRRGRAQLVIATFPYDLIAATVDLALQVRAVPRINFTLAASWHDGRLSLLLPEFGIEVGYGVEELARVLRHGQGTPVSSMLG